MVSACLEAYASHARRILAPGRAALLRVVPRAQRSWACRFTIPPPAAAAMRSLQDHLNQNQGAESSLAFYLSFAEMTRAETSFHREAQKLGAA